MKFENKFLQIRFDRLSDLEKEFLDAKFEHLAEIKGELALAEGHVDKAKEIADKYCVPFKNPFGGPDYVPLGWFRQTHPETGEPLDGYGDTLEDWESYFGVDFIGERYSEEWGGDKTDGGWTYWNHSGMWC